MIFAFSLNVLESKFCVMLIYYKCVTSIEMFLNCNCSSFNCYDLLTLYVQDEGGCSSPHALCSMKIPVTPRVPIKVVGAD